MAFFANRKSLAAIDTCMGDSEFEWQWDKPQALVNRQM